MSVEEISREVEGQAEKIRSVIEEVTRVIVGQKELIERLLVGLLADGHILVEGVPGLAKTTAVKALAATLQADFRRIQFTPDLLPADIIGTQIYSPKDGTFSVKKGPVFANLVLADEINRAPAKVQSALLEAMQEGQVTLGDESFILPSPFMVLATQNPIEQEGTYPLPEAQVDRFMLKVKVGYPSRDHEISIMKQEGNRETPRLQPILKPEAVVGLRDLANRIYLDEKLYDYIAKIVFATRVPKEFGLDDLSSLIEFGASPRASIALVQAVKAYAMIQGRGYVTPQDVKSIGLDVLRHRVMISYEAEAQGVDSDQLIGRIFDKIDVP